nr:H(+)/Cl(-) exchange transporter ClcA [Ignatzschineria sp. F8392]
MNYLKKFIHSDKTPMQILILAAIVGILVGFIGVLFQQGVDYLSQLRESIPKQYFSETWQVVATTFAISFTLSLFAYYIVKKFSPESGGSGIPEIEGALQDVRPVRWWRVLPVKFFGGLGTLSSGMVLGREGPTVQLGANLAAMVGAIFKVKLSENRHILLASGAAAGLSVAFNAPFAGVIFVIEEMREEFKYGLISFKAVLIGAIMSTVVYRFINGNASLLDVGVFGYAPMESLWLFIVMGFIIGVVGLLFNRSLLFLQDCFQAFYKGKTYRFILMGGIIGGSCGVIALYLPVVVGEGFNVIHDWTKGSFTLQMILIFFVIRFFTSIISFSSGAPGGVFSPLLALGTLSGAFFGDIAADLFPTYGLHAGMFAIAGMGALFAATVRAPLTGALLVLELTSNFALILPMLITCLGATIVAQLFGGRPLYTTLLKKTLAKENKQLKLPLDQN